MQSLKTHSNTKTLHQIWWAWLVHNNLAFTRQPIDPLCLLSGGLCAFHNAVLNHPHTNQKGPFLAGYEVEIWCQSPSIKGPSMSHGEESCGGAAVGVMERRELSLSYGIIMLLKLRHHNTHTHTSQDVTHYSTSQQTVTTIIIRGWPAERTLDLCSHR